MNAAEYALAAALLLVVVAPFAARGEQAEYDEYGRRPPQRQNELALPDPVLDQRWPMPEPGSPSSKHELLDDDEERLDPLHEDKRDDDAASGAAAPASPTQPQDMPESLENLLHRAPAAQGSIVPDQDDADDEARPHTGGANSAEK